MKQRQKFSFFLIALVIIPVFLLGLLGLNTLKTELTNYQLREKQNSAVQINRLIQQITSSIIKLQLSLRKDVEKVHDQGEWALRCTFQPQCSQYGDKRLDLIISINHDGDQIYPSSDVTGQLYPESQALKKLSSALSTARDQLSKLPLLMRMGGTWATYLTPQGHHLLYCWLGKNNYTFCAAINRNWLIGEASKILDREIPKNSLSEVRLVNVNQNIVWQNHPPNSRKVLAQKQLSYPLYFWSLEAMETVKPITNNYSLTITALTLPLAALLTAIAVMLFRTQNQALAEANKRAEFAASISHELRTPLTNLQLYADLILAKTTKSPSTENEHIIKYTNVIAKETTRLSGLVNNALTISKGKSANERQKTKAIPDHIITETISRLSPLLGDDMNNISYDLSADKEVMIDRSALEQILVNLIDNARKYAKGHKVRVSSKLHDDELTLIVKDWGSNFQTQNISSLLFPFFKKKPTKQKSAYIPEGFGLGLSVCKQLAQANNGSLTYQVMNPGARFIVTLKVQNCGKVKTSKG